MPLSHHHHPHQQVEPPITRFATASRLVLLSATPTLDKSQVALYQLPCHRCPPCSSCDPIACNTLKRPISARGALKKTLTRLRFSKTAITSSYGLGIRQKKISRTSTEKVTSIAPPLYRVPPKFFPKFGLEDWVFEPRSFRTLFRERAWFSVGHILHPFELKISVVVACVLLVQKKISEKYKKKNSWFLLVLKDKKEEHIENTQIIVLFAVSFSDHPF